LNAAQAEKIPDSLLSQLAIAIADYGESLEGATGRITLGIDTLGRLLVVI
jgi:hypothetical protein